MDSNPKPEGYVFGRPTKYKKEYCQLLVLHMSEGYSFESFAADVHVDRDTLYAWVKTHKDFSDAKKAGSAKCQKFWESKGIDYLFLNGQHEKFNSAVWVFNMKNRFGWRDVQEPDPDDVKKTVTLAYDTKKKNE